MNYEQQFREQLDRAFDQVKRAGGFVRAPISLIEIYNTALNNWWRFRK